MREPQALNGEQRTREPQALHGELRGDDIMYIYVLYNEY